MKVIKRLIAAMAVAAALLSASPAMASDVRIGWGFLFPIPLPIPIYEVPHEPSVVTVGLLFPIPIPLPVYDYGYHRARPAAERYGMMETRVRPYDAQVYVDGRYYGKTGDFASDRDAAALHPGRHEIEFRARGYKTYKLAADVGPGKLVTVEYEMQPER